MRQFGWSGARLIGAGCLALALVACGPKAASPTASASDERAYFDDLADLDFSVEVPATVPDIASAFASLPDGVRVEMGEVTLDQSNGAAVTTDFALLFEWNGMDVGLRAETARFWGFDPDVLDARINGRDLGETRKLADRIELNNIKTVGLAELYSALFDGYLDVVDDYADFEDEIFGEAFEMDVKTYEIGILQLVIDGLILEPFTYAAWAPEADAETVRSSELEFIHTVQTLAAGMRAFSFDAMFYRDMTLDYDVSTYGAESSMVISIPMTGIRGYQRGDMAYSGSWDTTMKASLPMPDMAAMEAGEVETPVFKSYEMSGGIALSVVEDVRLAKALEAVTNWSLPEASETDFMSFGRMLLVDYQLDFAGKPMFGLDRMELDLTQFHWLLPTKISLDVDNLSYQIGDLMAVMFEDLGEDLGPGMDMQMFQKGLAIAKQYEFDCFCGDYSVEFSWDEKTGDVGYREQGQLMAAFQSLTTLDMTVPKPATIAALLTDDDGDEAAYELALGLAFTEAFEFRSAKGQITDTGGLTRLFEMAHAIGEAFPEQEGMSILAYNSPEQLRDMAVSSFSFVRPMVREELPAAEAWLDAVSDFVSDGGVLTWQFAPKKPLTVVTFVGFGNDPDPAEIVETLGFSVTHTK